MKNILLLLTVLLGFSQLYADDYKPFVEEGKVWHMHHEVDIDLPEYTYDFDYFIQGDTIIAGKECKRVFSRNLNNDNATEYQCALFEEGKIVYLIKSGQETAHLIYNFDLSVGDKISKQMYENEFFYVKEITCVNMHGISRRAFLIEDTTMDSPYNRFWLIEGIGNDRNPIAPFYYFAPGNYNSLNSCELNGEIIYDNSDAQQLAVNYTPLVREGIRWVYLYSDVTTTDGYNPETNEEYPIWSGKGDYAYFMEFRGDTIINDINYKKLYCSLTRDFNENSLRPIAYLREADKHVYGISDRMGINQFINSHNLVMPQLGNAASTAGSSWQEYELYDFNDIEAFTRQNLSVFWGDDFEISLLMKTISINNEPRNAYFIDIDLGEYDNPIPFKIVEGVGCEEIDMLSYGPNLGIPTCICPIPLGLAQQETTGGDVIYHGISYYGPYHGNKMIDVEDVNHAINIILGNSIYSRHYLNDISDFNGDYKVDIEDVNAMINRILKIE